MAEEITIDKIKLRYTLQDYKKEINQIAWSPNGKTLVSPSNDGTIQIWDTETGQLLRTVEGQAYNVNSVAWSPSGEKFASGSTYSLVLWDASGTLLKRFNKPPGTVNSISWSPNDRMLALATQAGIQIWSLEASEPLSDFIDHSDVVNNLAYSPNGRMLASGTSDKTICIWNIETKELIWTLKGHANSVLSVAWSPDGNTLASGSLDTTIRHWDLKSGQQTNILEVHTDGVNCVSFSFDGRLLASKSLDGHIRIWRCDVWETVAILNEPSSGRWYPGLAFHPKKPALATLGEKDSLIRLWDLDTAIISSSIPITSSVHYTNAKVVLVGDTGVGKSGLCLSLTGQAFVPTESTHGRKVWTFDSERLDFKDGHKETRETLLWDLAGQPGYRLIHQLHLNEVAVALIVFDARNEEDPFASVRYWERSLRQAQHLQGNLTLPMRKFLIAARIDRGGRAVSRTRLQLMMDELGFDGYFETSAKEKLGIVELTQAIQRAIEWEAFPHVSSTNLFQLIKDFLLVEKGAGRLLSTADDLYYTFLKSTSMFAEITELRTQFETCIVLLESRGLIRQLSFGSFILLQPELLDTYASALINAVKDEPDGMGSITEAKARAGDFFIPKDERYKNKKQEALLLSAMIEDLLLHEIALREQGDDGPLLVFPSQLTRENLDPPDLQEKTVVFDFKGPVQNIYATLAVRLSHSGLFQKKGMWKNAVAYTTKLSGTYGMSLNNKEEGLGDLTLFFDEDTSNEMRFHFEEYVQAHLQRRALPESIYRRRIFICPKPECKTEITDTQVIRRRALGHNWIRCNVCETRVSLLDEKEQLTNIHSSLISHMDRVADSQRELLAAASILQSKREIAAFDVFLCHNVEDKPEVKKIGDQLKERGILPWLDEWELQPGLPWQRLLEQEIKQIKSAAVFIGTQGMGPWQHLELEAFLRKFVDRGCPVIPVYLSYSGNIAEFPPFLEGMTWVDFRKQDPNPIERLIWGITGMRGSVKH